jgi:hypothetical protein
MSHQVVMRHRNLQNFCGALSSGAPQKKSEFKNGG